MEATPIDPVSRLALLLKPHDEVLPFVWGEADNSAVLADLNHVHHPRTSPLLQGVNGGFAVRQSRGQIVMRSDHNLYHEYCSGPWLPSRRSERLQTVVLSAAMYIPAQCIDVRGGQLRIENLTESQRARLRSSGEVRVIDQGAVRRFLMDCVVKADVDHIKPFLVEEFLSLHPDTEESSLRQRELTHLLLSLTLEPLADPIDAIYCKGRKTGLMAAGLPARPRDFMSGQLIGRNPRSINKVKHIMQRKLSLHSQGIMPHLFDLDSIQKAPVTPGAFVLQAASRAA
jgi:hypothetical protein